MLATQDKSDLIENVVIEGDLSKLSPAQRVNYYKAVCQSVGLNPLTKPFDYLRLNNKLVLYARKDAAEQLRKIHDISITNIDIEYIDDLVQVKASAKDKNGKTDSDVGIVTIGKLAGDAKANAIMKAVTKSKRRVTLSIAGLGWLDETEIETIPDAQPVVVDESGEIVDNGHGDPETEVTEEKTTTKKPKTNGKSVGLREKMVEAGYASNVSHAGQIAHKLQLGNLNEADALELAKQYRALRDEGKTSKEAAAEVLAEEISG